MSSNSREKILAAAKQIAQARGYNGLNFRDLAEVVGIKAPSIYHHFPTKADLAAAVARRYWEDFAAELESMSAKTPDPIGCLRQYPGTFRKSLEDENRICLSSFMAAESDDLPEPVKQEVRAFADVNVAVAGPDADGLGDRPGRGERAAGSGDLRRHRRRPVDREEPVRSLALRRVGRKLSLRRPTDGLRGLTG